jgi:hypothetical protein
MCLERQIYKEKNDALYQFQSQDNIDKIFLS